LSHICMYVPFDLHVDACFPGNHRVNQNIP
jgi:hypothetical protein